MKVGMIFECGPDGADKKVCEHLARMLLPEIEISSVTLGNKPKLISECGLAAAQLLGEGCERVVIVWDLYPPWRKSGQRPCRRADREAIAQSLSRAGVRSRRVYLVCIAEELEAWLLADGRAISAVLSKSTHPVDVGDTKKPEQVSNPKKRLTRIFREKTGRLYVDRVHAEKIIQALSDLNRIKRCATFVRFAIKATGRKP
ncbi:MAG: hypothetical protein A3F84_10135 [Candidatus Handelsmanbacteria bacterium RIFCSPLOWO2_12_FULL_64_10]|uniref:DUF4276 family protein n=1 Tax=Handelsmanbacteria sp. (strain RIFCSPLOWO2_12_FULL_64_10) TaxID=1817868 RepID=A0A1F6D461_HANXR|nr:MAG: hypothetical protein A3F84_10135 [Candidatus Handelsmanbacteria bacterium RIFCSPLOWO2_12_FULL_64_10]